MKVKDLIKLLEKYDEDYEVNVLTSWSYDEPDCTIGDTEKHDIKTEVRENKYLKTLTLSATDKDRFNEYEKEYNKNADNKTLELSYAYHSQSHKTDITPKQQSLLKLMRYNLPNEVYTINHLDNKESARLFIQDHMAEFQKNYQKYIDKQKKRKQNYDNSSYYYDDEDEYAYDFFPDPQFF